MIDVVPSRQNTGEISVRAFRVFLNRLFCIGKILWHGYRCEAWAFVFSPEEGCPVFNKSTLFNRNDAIQRRDTTVPQTAVPRSDVTPNEGTPTRVVQPTRDVMASARAAADKPATATPPPAVAEDLRPAGSNGVDTDSGMGARLIVGPEVKLKGAEILDCDTLVVEGRVEATMDSRVVRIAEHGSFIGKVSIDIAEIHGTFEGELTARSQLIIHSTGRVKGTIRYGKLVADEGCQLCGDINVLSGNAAPAKVAVEPLVVLNAAVG